MSKTVDERVVEMRFDNQQFERNVQTSLGTLERLKKGLNLEESAKSLDDVTASVKKMDFSPLTTGIETVKNKFSALEVMAVTALANVTNSIVNTGRQMLRSLTIEPIKQGYEEYELKLGSVQTIMASTGASLEEVNGYLDELNTYADKTIYSFSDMTASIGKFTNAGVDLKSAVKAIQGISNEAAVSGANTQQASHAMYNFAQALSSGAVKLIDWKSIENANMATVEFKQQLIDTAVELGTLVKKGDKYSSTTTNLKGEVSDAFTATSMFNDSLSFQWMTTDVLVKTLGKYADETTEIGKKAFAAAQDVKTFTQLMDTLKEAVGSGWAQTWETIFGDFEEAKVLWTDVSNVVGGFIDTQSKARNDLLQGWKDLGGRTVLIEAFKNTFDGLVSVATPIKDAFREIFPKTTSEQLLKITENLRDFTAKLKLNDEQAEKLKTAFKGLFSVIDVGLTAVKAMVKGVISLAKNFSGVGNAVLNAASAMGDWLSGLRDSVKQTDIFGKAVNTVVTGLQKAIDKIKEFFSSVKQRLDAVEFTTFLNVLKGIYNFAVKVGKVILNVGKTIGSTLLGAFRDGGLSSVIDVLNGGIFGAILVNIAKFTGGISDAFGGIGDILGNVSGILEGVKGCLESWQQSIKADILLKIAKAIAILAASLFVIALIDDDKLTNALAGVTAMFIELMSALKVFNKLNLNFGGVGKSVTMMIGMSTAVLILAGALKSLSSLSWDELARGLVGVAGLMAVIVTASAALSKIKGKAMKGALNVVIFAAAIKVLSSAVKDLATMSWDELARGLTGVGALMASVAVFLNTAKMNAKSFVVALGVIELAAAIKILGSAVKDFAGMSGLEICKGLAAVGALLTEIGLFTNLTGNAKHVFSTGLALIEISAAMKIFASVMKDFSGMELESLSRGLAGMGGALTEITIALKLMPKNTFGIGAGLVVVGSALGIIASVMSKIGEQSLESIAKGLISLGSSMSILALGLNGMKSSIGGAAALTVAAGALALLVPELRTLGGMSIEQVGIGLLALAGAFTVLGVGARLLKPLVGTMLKVAAAITLFGAGCALAGAGILAVSVALTALSASLVVIAASLGEIIVGVCDSVANSADAISRMLVGLIKSACVALKETVPLIADTILTVLVQSLTSMREYLPQIVDLVADILVDLMDGLSLRVPELAKSAVNMVGKFIDALNNALGTDGLSSLIGSLKSVSIIFVAFAETAKIISELKIKDVVKGIPAFAAAVAGFGIILAALGGLAQIPGISEVMSNGANLFAVMGNALGAFVGSVVAGFITNMPSDLSQTITAMGGVVAVVAAFAPVLKIFNELDVNIKSVLNGMAGTGLVLAGITAVLAALGGLKQIPGFEWILGEGTKVLSLIGVAIGTFIGSIVDSLANSVTSSLEKVVSSLGSVGVTIGAVALIAKIVGKLKIDPASVAEGFAGVAVAIGCIEVILAALGGLAQIPGFEWIVGEGGRVLSQLGTILGEFVGSIISGIGIGLTSGLPQMGQNLSGFMTAIQPFIDGAKGVDKSVMDGILSLSAAVLCITAADILNGIASFITGGSSIADFGEEIAKLGPHLKVFSDSVDGISPENVAAAANAAKSLAEMADTIPNEGGVVAWFAGENSISKFGNDIVGFGGNLKKFSDNVAGISPENVVAAANAGKALAEMADTIPNEGGVAAWFAGENSVSKFGEDIVSFGESLKSFSDKVTGIIPENVVAAANAGKTLAEMASAVPNAGGMASWFAGENNVADFGKDIASFGGDLAVFSDNVSGIKPDKVTAAANAAKTLAEMAGAVPNAGGLAGWFAGENNVAAFGKDIASFGGNLADFSKNVSGITPSTITAAANAAKTLAEMAGAVPNAGGLAGWFAGENNVAAFGEDIASFGKNLAAFSDNVSGISPENVTSAANAAKTLAEMTTINIRDVDTDNFGTDITGVATAVKTFSTSMSGVNPQNAIAQVGKVIEMAKEIQNEDLSGLNGLASSLKSVADDGVTKFINAFKDAGSKIKESVTTFVNKVIEAIQSLNPDFSAAGNNAASCFTDGLMGQSNAIKTDFGNCGKNAVEGFSNGIKNNAYLAKNAASEMAKAALDAAKKELDINSPSREFYSAGDYSGLGFVGALEDYGVKAYNAGAKMANSAKEGLSKTISGISDIINGNVEYQPTIRPVLDLSDVNAKAKALNSTFSAELAISVNAGINNAKAERTQNGGESLGTTTYSFTQNINSPKAVDAKTVYRQTKNQFSRMMEVAGLK